MLKFKRHGSLVKAQTQFFSYRIDKCKDQPELWQWSVFCTGEGVGAGGPDYLDECKTQCEQDYATRIDQAQRIIKSGKYQK